MLTELPQGTILQCQSTNRQLNSDSACIKLSLGKNRQIIPELLQVWKQKNIAIIHKLASYQSGILPINDVLYVQILSVG